MASSCKKNIVIVHYNTPYLTECLVRSINLFVKDAIIYIFDNSDKSPFTAKFDNVTIIDNTKGQIIDFDKWLEKYPNRNKSNGKVNNWGSAKHCYSVEKCMELINDNFVLLDSDILLKRDISNLFIENKIFIGDVVTQPKSTIKRVLPFICFINVKMCKENGIHYFYDDYMHGLYKNSMSDRYDTGAGFYIKANKYNNVEIKCENYIEHYGHGSWKKAGEAPKLSKEEWALKYKKYWFKENTTSMNKDYTNELVAFCKRRGFNINLTNPRTIQDKINWLKLNNLTQLKTDCADKVKLHNYCEKKLGKDICVPIIKVYNNTNEIKWDELPEKFVIKCNHGSGMNIIVNKNSFDKTNAINKLNRWMNTDFAFQNGYEMQYHNIERKIFAEEFLVDDSQKKSLYDYKFWCFNGKPVFFTVNDGNGHGSWMNFYDMNCNELPYKRVDFNGVPDGEVRMPSNLNEMIEYSKKLSSEFEFVRVDFYEVNNKVYLGELTFTPNSGFLRYIDAKYDLQIGNYLKLNINKKKVVYTCITGGYDSLIEPTYISEGFDYICFTDNMDLKSKTWKIRPLPKEVEGLSQVKKQRYVKINAHKVLPEYDLSIWVDGNVTLRGDLNEFLKKSLKNDVSVYIPQHPARNCIYDEATAVIRLKKDKPEIVNKQIERYKKEGFPAKYGLLQSNIILRKHNSPDCAKLMEAWFNELKNESHRDQLSFNYVSWKNKDVKVSYLDKKIYDSVWFKWNTAHKGKKNTIVNKTVAPIAQPVVKKNKTRRNDLITQDIGLY